MGVDCFALLTHESSRKAVLISVPRSYCVKSGDEYVVDFDKAEELVETFFSEIQPKIEGAKGDKIDEVLTLGNFIKLYYVTTELALTLSRLIEAGPYWLEVFAELNNFTVEFLSELTVEDEIVKRLESGEIEEVIIVPETVEVEHERVKYPFR